MTQSEKAILERLDRIEKTLSTAIAWIAQSSVGVLSVDDAKRLIAKLAMKEGE
jgi:hypothetical protein